MKSALAYARLGWSVLPLHDVTSGACSCGKPDCRSAGKHPRIAEWQKLATADESTVAEWVEQYPHANVGVATGAASGFFVLDIDSPESLDELEAEHGELPHTVQATTGSGGAHYLFQLPAFPVPNTASKIAPGIDTRGDGGQIVVAPSVSLKGAYAWVNGPWNTPIAPAPAWILDAVRPARAETHAPALVNRFPAATPEVLEEARAALERWGPAIEHDGGDQHTFAAAALLRRDFALAYEEAWPLFLEWNESCVPPWNEGDLAAKLRGGEKYGTSDYGARRTMDALATAMKLVQDFDAVPGGDPMVLVRQVRTLTWHDPGEREIALHAVKDATGLSVRSIDLQKPINKKALEARAQRREAHAKGKASELVDSENMLAVAEQFLRSTQDDVGFNGLVRWQDDYWLARGTYYEQTPPEAVLSDLYAWTKGKRDVNTNAEIKPDRALIEALAHAVRGAAFVKAKEAPAWLDSAEHAPPSELIAFPNGLLHVETRDFAPPTRAFFNLNSLTFDYNPHAWRPEKWHEFLGQLWGNDRESIETLQELMGLALTQDTSFQKLFMLIGPPRCGKGTVARVLAELVGKANAANPTLNSLSAMFGIETLIGKQLAIVSDARLSPKTDIGAVVENLLRISGEDSVSVPRKYRQDYTAKLTSRFLILSNEVPGFVDQSGALASRFVILKITPSFLGREDLTLTQTLTGELPGILLWALEGLDRLRARGHFRQPSASAETVRQLYDLSSPIKAFVEDCCALESAAEVDGHALYLAWCEWAVQQGREHPGTVQVFGRNLSSAFPSLRVSNRRQGTKRSRFYEGIKLIAS